MSGFEITGTILTSCQTQCNVCRPPPLGKRGGSPGVAPDSRGLDPDTLGLASDTLGVAPDNGTAAGSRSAGLSPARVRRQLAGHQPQLAVDRGQ